MRFEDTSILQNYRESGVQEFEGARKQCGTRMVTAPKQTCWKHVHNDNLKPLTLPDERVPPGCYPTGLPTRVAVPHSAGVSRQARRRVNAEPRWWTADSCHVTASEYRKRHRGYPIGCTFYMEITAKDTASYKSSEQENKPTLSIFRHTALTMS